MLMYGDHGGCKRALDTMFMARATWSSVLESCLSWEQGKMVLSPAQQWLGDAEFMHAWHCSALGEMQRERKTLR